MPGQPHYAYAGASLIPARQQAYASPMSGGYEDASRAPLVGGCESSLCTHTTAWRRPRVAGAKKKKKAASKGKKKKASSKGKVKTAKLTDELIAKAHRTIVTALKAGYTLDRVIQFLHLKEGYPMPVLQSILSYLRGSKSKSKSRSRAAAPRKRKAKK